MQQPAQSEQTWYVQAAGRVWGPYPSSRLEAFAAEGRVTPATSVSPRAEGPFAPARDHRDLRPLFGSDQQPASTSSRGGALRPLVVWGDLKSLSPERFETVLAAYGAFAPIRPGLWLIQARLEPAALRNALSRRLRGEDALLVVEAALDRAAWFNLGGSAERALRHLWAAGVEG